jgi:hypothetical protein
LLQQLSASRREQAVVADFDEAVRQDMLQEAAHELFGCHSGKFDLFSGRVFVFESNASLIEFDDTLVGDGDTEDVRGEILKAARALPIGCE